MSWILKSAIVYRLRRLKIVRPVGMVRRGVPEWSVWTGAAVFLGVTVTSAGVLQETEASGVRDLLLVLTGTLLALTTSIAAFGIRIEATARSRFWTSSRAVVSERAGNLVRLDLHHKVGVYITGTRTIDFALPLYHLSTTALLDAVRLPLLTSRETGLLHAELVQIENFNHLTNTAASTLAGLIIPTTVSDPTFNLAATISDEIEKTRRNILKEFRENK